MSHRPAAAASAMSSPVSTPLIHCASIAVSSESLTVHIDVHATLTPVCDPASADRVDMVITHDATRDYA